MRPASIPKASIVFSSDTVRILPISVSPLATAATEFRSASSRVRSVMRCLRALYAFSSSTVILWLTSSVNTCRAKKRSSSTLMVIRMTARAAPDSIQDPRSIGFAVSVSHCERMPSLASSLNTANSNRLTPRQKYPARWPTRTMERAGRKTRYNRPLPTRPTRAKLEAAMRYVRPMNSQARMLTGTRRRKASATKPRYTSE